MPKMENMFFEFRYVKTFGTPFCISCDSKIASEVECYAEEYAKTVLSECSSDGKTLNIKLKLGISDAVKTAVGEVFSEDNEAYAIEIKQDESVISATTENGLIYAVSTLKQLIEGGNVCEMLIFDYPDKKVRGYRVFIPGRENFDDFKRMVDMLVYYKYNAIMIEVGGAMEYKKHPEINSEWVEFCREVHKSPNEAKRIQKETYADWKKNSIHADNGGGSFVTQEELRELVAYCKERGLEVIPEVPTLSHCDYIVRAHRELNERCEDMYPDTYCPSNLKTYELVFDILDEIVEVFNPRYINIGHDELYTLGKCPLCKGKNPVDLYVGDIIKISDYLKKKNVKTIIWSEKLLDNLYFPGPGDEIHGYGGTGDEVWDIPRLAECAGKVPKDVILLHWYWSLCSGDAEHELLDMGYDMIFGNFQALSLKDYRARSQNIPGGFVSNWGSFEEEYMQRNGQNFNLLATAYVFWNDIYDSPKSFDIQLKVKDELYARYKKSLGENIIEVIHTTDYFKPYTWFYDGIYIVPEDWLIGHHEVVYTDGTKTELPIVYGYNVRSENEKETSDSGSEEARTTSYIEILGASYPEIKNGRMFYRTAYKNPYPEKTIKQICVKSKDGIKIEARYDAVEGSGENV
ncbi:MAG: beta-N-acetylhexosaminidase [Ruminococcaceae bacterium]|nr:beta-N-acetylhexosaminidase [Oscillospiraceae bacterium]